MKKVNFKLNKHMGQLQEMSVDKAPIIKEVPRFLTSDWPRQKYDKNFIKNRTTCAWGQRKLALART